MDVNTNKLYYILGENTHNSLEIRLSEYYN